MIKEKRILLAILFIGLPLIVSAQINQATPDLPQELITEANTLNNTSAQVEALTGTVVDAETDEPLPGVNILLKGTSRGTSTNVDGEFELEVESLQDTLIVSYIGYQTMEVPINGRTELDLSLQPQAITGEELVVVGYGTQERSTLAGSVETVDATSFEGRSITNTADAFQGTVPGLIVTQTSSQPGNKGLALQLRGLSSINGGNTPLVLVDGIQSDLEDLNPNDIESVSVIKDGAAAIYGNQAANGVIIVTTKQGTRNTSPEIEYNYTIGRNTPTYIYEKFTTRQYMEVVNAGFVNDGSAPLYPDIFFDAIGTDTVLNFNQTRLGGAEREDSYLVFDQTNNQFIDEFFENGMRQNHSLSVSGGGNNNTYRLSLGYLSEDGVVDTRFDGFERYNVRLNNTFDITDDITLQTSNALEVSNQSSSQQLGQALNRVRTNWTMAPIRRPDGQFYTFRGFLNPLDLLDQAGENTTRGTRILSNAKIDYSILDQLTATVNAGVNWRSIDGRVEVPTINLINEWTVDENPGSRVRAGTQPNRLVESNGSETYANFSGHVTYEETFGDMHDISLTGGLSHEQRKDNFETAETRDFPTNDLFSLAIGNIDEARVNASGYAWTLRSLFGRANYVFNNKYIIEGNLRYDGSSRFTPDRRWGLFKGALIAWRASEEDFIKNLGLFDNLKFRVSYGETGNQQGIGYYDYLSLINSGGRIIFGQPSGGLFGSQSENEAYFEAGAVSLDRSWETVASTNFGVDVGMAEDRLNVSFDYFIKRNKDLLVNVNAPTVLGISAPRLNRGELETKGWELSLTWSDNIGEFNYYAKGVLFNDNNELINLEGSQGVKNPGVNNDLEGYSVGTYFGWKFDGIIQNEQELEEYTSRISSGLPGGIGVGDVRYADVDGNGELSALGNPSEGDTGDLVKLGNIRPQYSFSLDLGGNYKNFDFRVLFQGVGKRTLFRGGTFSAPIQGGAWFNQGLKYFYGKTWTPENTDAKYPELSVNAGVNNYNYRPSANNKINGAYVRLKNLQIGYTLSSNVLENIPVSRLRVFLTGENLFELQSDVSRKLNFDPEAGTSWVSYPFVRTYSAGLQVTF
ncbi:MAG: TonB-dependent receptor [Balneolaceae bacterium]|nr:TonB-dependent receptor [Balneolaceae bacterium]